MTATAAPSFAALPARDLRSPMVTAALAAAADVRRTAKTR